MKAFFAFLLVLMSCHTCKAQYHSSNNDISPQAPYGEEMAETTRPGTEGGEEEQVSQSDIWAELRDLRDMVVEQAVELRYLTTRLAAAESLVESLQEQNTAMEARLTATELMAEELRMEYDAQSSELAVAQQKLSTLQDRVTVNEHQVTELEKQQEGQSVTVQKLQNANRVREVAFSVSLLASGEGAIETEVCTQNHYAHIITNIGNHYNPHTGYFTAPVRGVYYFRFTGHAANSTYTLMLKLKKNNEFIIVAADRAVKSDHDPEDNASNGAVLQLEVGDVVSVQTCGSVWDDRYHRTTFSGFMLFPL